MLPTAPSPICAYRRSDEMLSDVFQRPSHISTLLLKTVTKKNKHTQMIK